RGSSPRARGGSRGTRATAAATAGGGGHGAAPGARRAARRNVVASSRSGSCSAAMPRSVQASAQRPTGVSNRHTPRPGTPVAPAPGPGTPPGAAWPLPAAAPDGMAPLAGPQRRRPQVQAGVGDHELARDMARLGTAEEEHGLGDVLGLAGELERRVAGRVLLDLRRLLGAQALGEPVGTDIAGADRVDPDLRGEAAREAQGERVERAL